MDTDSHGSESELTKEVIGSDFEVANEHLAQCFNYLKASGLQVALLVNFQKPKVEWKRALLDRSAD